MDSGVNDEGAGKQSSRATPADQMRVVGSGRRKVALPPGRSQLDWVRNSRSLPCRTAGHFPMSEVRKHNKRSDAWIVVRGAIFDVTPYLEYHPGGIDMLMSGVGKDATRLFEKYHPWVNPNFMLERCLVGYLEHEATSAADLP